MYIIHHVKVILTPLPLFLSSIKHAKRFIHAALKPDAAAATPAGSVVTGTGIKATAPAPAAIMLIELASEFNFFTNFFEFLLFAYLVNPHQCLTTLSTFPP